MNLRLAITEIINGGVEQYAECCHGLLLADEILALLTAQGIETRSATDAERRGPKGESPVAKRIAQDGDA